jgi:catechol 2,3-dioxygenase-like lactoylglutathione lyase family enzyme
MAVPRICHVTVDVGDRLEEAARRYRALGFNLTPRPPSHSLGSANHFAMFAPEYIELLSPGSGARPDLAGYPVGLNGLVFAMEGAEALHEDLLARGLPVQSVQRFSRAVDLPDGETGEARINVVRIEPRTVFDGRTYFCEHLSPELIWRPEWQAHPNGARGLERIALSARDPNAVANVFDRMFGPGAVARTTGQGGPHVLRAGKVAVEVWPQDELSRTLGPAMPDPAGRADHLVLLGIRVHSLRETRELLRANGIHIAAVGVNRILVPSTEAMNVAMEFVA